jgi:sugar/nucleoside kinase (ribokinase family)
MIRISVYGYDMSSKSILALGGAHLDRRARISGETVAGASNPGSWHEEAGGGVFNAARNLARLGHRVTLVAPRGGDSDGERVSIAANDAGVIDRPFTFLDRRTPSYTAILEQDGNLVIGIADMDLYKLFTPRRLLVRAVRDAISASDFLLTDANLPAETLAALGEVAVRNGIPLAAIAISPAKVVRLKPVLPHFRYIFMNAAEAHALSGSEAKDWRDWPSIMRDTGLEGGVITRGQRPAIAWSGEQSAFLQPASVTEIADVTGAGDGFAAGFLHAIINGCGLTDALRHAGALARLTLESQQATCETLTPVMLQEALALAGQAELLKEAIRT